MQIFDFQTTEPFLNVLSTYASGFNFLDVIIIVVILFYVFEGYSLGLIGAIFDLVSFILSFILGIKFYNFIGQSLFENFSIPIGFANAIGFFIAAAVSEILLNIFFKNIFSYFFASRFESNQFSDALRRLNKFLGIFPGVASAFVLLSFFLTLIAALPVSPMLKKTISGSKMGSVFVSKTIVFEKNFKEIFGGAVNDTLNFLTIHPQSNEFVSLKFKTTNFQIDSLSEMEMFERVNKERKIAGVTPLIFDNNIRDVTRSHSSDMFKRGYFSHYTPEKFSPFDRLSERDIPFTFAGENLALAPSVDLAMQGLMNSPGHKANILSPNFKKIGIGAIDGGIYGIMFTQNFTD